MEINITVRDKIASGDGTWIVCGNSDYIVRFTLDSEWDQFITRTMIVVNADKTYQEVVFTGDTAALPVINNQKSVSIGLYAGDLHTTTSAYFNCKKSARDGLGEHEAPSEDVYNQLVQLVENGAVKGEKGEKGEKGDKGDKGEPGQDAPQEAVLYTTQTLSDAQKAQARGNIDAADKESVDALNGDLDDLIVKEYYSNRVDENKTESGYYLSSAGLPVPDDTYSTTDYADITGLSTIYLNLNTKHPAWKNNIYFCLYDEQKTFIKRGNCASTGSAIDVTSSFSAGRFVRISYITAENSKVYVGDKTEYEPYGLKEKIIQPSNETVKARSNFNTLNDRLNAIENGEKSKPKTVLYFGDSLTEGAQDHNTAGSYISRKTVLSELLGEDWAVKNYGVGGEKSNTISARSSGIWFYLDAGVTIPSDGSTVDVSAKIHDNFGNGQNFGNGIYSSAYGGWITVNPCYVNGVECTLQKANASAPVTIKRNTVGDAINITRPTRIHFNSETFEKNPVLILCLGQNEGFNRDADILISQIKGIIEFYNAERYIVVGIPHALYGYKWEAPINESLKKEFGKHYLDIEGYMKTPIYDADRETIISSYALSDAGLTPTEDDLTKISNNQYPTSIMFDGVHFNHYGYEIWANVEYKLGKDLGYWD